MGTIGIFGGSFNPVHWGHILVAEAALQAGGLDQVIWVPTYHPPHKPAYALRFDQRLAMVALAIAHQPQFSVSDVSAWRDQPSFAIATLQDLQGQYPGNQWFWILGMDAFQTVKQWRQWETLRAQCIWLVAPRPENRIAAPIDTVSLRWQLLDMPPLAVSSSQIRWRSSQGESIHDAVPIAVRDYIKTHHLYQSD